MDPRAYYQHTIWAAAISILMTMLLFQGTGGLECYSCLEEEDRGCSAANITIIQCAAPMNICIEYIQTVSTGAFMVTRRKKGCSMGATVGISANTTDSTLYHVSNIRACSTDRCNNQLPNSTETRPPSNTTDSNVTNGMECYSCTSFLKDQCSPRNAAKVNCTGDRTRCYEGNVTIVLYGGDSSKAIYFKTCEVASFCLTSYYAGAEYATIKQEGSCCSGKYCNGPASNTMTTTSMTTSKPNSQVPCSSVSHFSLLVGILLVIGIP